MATRLPHTSLIWIVIATLLGLIATVAVSWAIVAVTNQWTTFVRAVELIPDNAFVPGYLSPDWPRCVAASRTPINAGADFTLLTLVAGSDQATGNLSGMAWNEGVPRLRLEQQRYGWPFRAMYIEVFGIQGNLPREVIHQRLEETYNRAGMRTGIVLWEAQQGNGTPDKRFPAAVLPLGLLLDTAIFGAAWWALLVGPTTLKRRRRLARGLCANCGYQIESADRCPECGTPNPRATACPPHAA